jgi:hypothetical protein
VAVLIPRDATVWLQVRDHDSIHTRFVECEWHGSSLAKLAVGRIGSLLCIGAKAPNMIGGIGRSDTRADPTVTDRRGTPDCNG